MVRFLVLYDTPADPEAFDRHYRDVHIPLAKQLPGLRRYTVSRNHGAVRGDLLLRRPWPWPGPAGRPARPAYPR